jgi:hypothetical protein
VIAERQFVKFNLSKSSRQGKDNLLGYQGICSCSVKESLKGKHIDGVLHCISVFATNIENGPTTILAVFVLHITVIGLQYVVAMPTQK